jgi:heterodisulfide reductase subunit A
MNEEPRIGVFVCHCGTNIGGVVNVPEVTEYAKTLPNVVFAQDNLYTCSEAGLEEIRKGIKEENLNRVIVASCTPRTHQPLFRRTCEESGLNPYLFEFVNIREQCSWVHMQEKEAATEKAKELIRMGVAKASLLEPLERVTIGVEPKALVMGGGIAGMTAALSLANAGFEVKLVEKEKELGGMLRNIYKLYPTNQEASNFLAPKIKAVKEHPNIKLYLSSEVKDVKGFIGNYEVTVAGEEEENFKVGAIILAVGGQLLEPKGMYNYDGSKIITQLQLEGMLKENKFEADNVVMIQCVGSRSVERSYCSRTCCMTAIKNALLIKEMNPKGSVFILYRDLQTYGVEYEDYLREAKEKGVKFIRYSPEKPPIVWDGEVRIFHSLLGREMELDYDLLVLSTATVAQCSVEDISKMLKVPLDKDKFFLEAHVKLRPVEFATAGVFLCGSVHSPKPISEAIVQAEAAAAKAAAILSKEFILSEGDIAEIDKEKCMGCQLCLQACYFSAIAFNEELGVCEVNRVVCKGCGKCAVICPSGACQICGFTDRQILSQVGTCL